ncbi:transcriptional regulator [Methanomethylovorans hollandica DSM 15978]|uniref:Transcriptional regulator n=1 Tax=Methanomethylovorans hollandica (strain DSM 15978 / NBRC 107637 / DMS1) TaxID=867904 RepID=L0L1T1_METHD|nr:MarR family transcriptional regulator [Methanomethylovorans hollandica]AGB50343.1 transcriptional regulator [Methanomethylovorans hollandica DSM 15978]
MDENVLLHKIIDIIQYKNEYQLQTSRIPPQEMYVLERIYLHNNILSKDISQKYNIPPSTLTGILDRLENKKLIARLKTNKDRRSIELVATENGKSAVEKHITEDHIFARNLFDGLEPLKREQFKALLEELLDNIELVSMFFPKHR